MDHEIKEKAEKLRKEKWIESIFMIEAIAVNKEFVEESLKGHIDKLQSIKDVFVYDVQFMETIKIDKPLKNIDEAYSQIVEVKLFSKNVFTLLTLIVLYGPSSIEILGPNSTNVNIDELQHISISIADLIHQFAAAGAGGIVMTHSKK